jgi:hypothetical protein
MRIALAVLCAAVIAAAAAFVVYSENTLLARRNLLHDVDLHAHEATEGLVGLRVAQQAYVAVGQGTEFWMPKVDAATPTVGGALAALQKLNLDAASRAAVDAAVAAFVEFGNVDQRIRGYLKNDAQLMAADIVFTEGGEAAATAVRDVETARLDAHVAFDSLEAQLRKREALAIGGAAALAFVVILGLASAPRRVEVPVEATASAQVVAEEPAAHTEKAGRTDLPLRPDVSPVVEAERSVPVRPDSDSADLVFLKETAQLCTDIGRVRDLSDLKTLLARAADLLDASGLMLWLASGSGSELRLALAHGYSPQVSARTPSVPRSADNAAAAAYRTGALQIVPSHAASRTKGAIVAPVLSVDGCIGVLSAEIRGGREYTATAQALATIVAAQLGGVVGVPTQIDERAAGGAAL